MAHEGDLESQTNHHEETPLLSEEQLDQQVDQKEPQKRRGSWYLWRIFWAVVAIVVSTVFIKGWIDAGSDVDVGAMMSHSLYV